LLILALLRTIAKMLSWHILPKSAFSHRLSKPLVFSLRHSSPGSPFKFVAEALKLSVNGAFRSHSSTLTFHLLCAGGIRVVFVTLRFEDETVRLEEDNGNDTGLVGC